MNQSSAGSIHRVRIRRIVLCMLMLAPLLATAGIRLGDLNWQTAEQQLKQKIVIIPFAAGAKEHGPHLPLATDQIVMEHLLELALDQRDVIVAPPVLHGWFAAFRDYPGTEVADPTVFQDYLRHISESLVRSGATRLVYLNLGIAKATGLPISIVARDIRSNHNVATLVLSWDDLETDDAAQLYEQERGGHADEGETSIMLYLRPDLVDMSRATRDYRGEKKSQTGYAPGKFDRSTETGLYGDATLASADKGKQILGIMARNWLLALDQFEANTRQ